MGMALGTMGELFTSLVDVTIVYPDKVPTFIEALSGRLGDVVVHVQQHPIPANARQRAQLQIWLNSIWQEKDQTITQVLAEHTAKRP